MKNDIQEVIRSAADIDIGQTVDATYCHRQTLVTHKVINSTASN